MPGSRNLVIFLGIALVIYVYWTGAQRAAMASLWAPGPPNTSPTPSPLSPSYWTGYFSENTSKHDTQGLTGKALTNYQISYYKAGNHTLPAGASWTSGFLSWFHKTFPGRTAP